MRKLTTPRLSLEPLTREHAPELFAALSDPAIYRYIEEKPPVSLDALAERYARLESRKSADGREHWLNWAVREIASGAAVGFVQATAFKDRSAFVAYVIAPAYQKRGFAREATAAMNDELRASYNVRRFRASVDPRNAASIALLVALGFTESAPDGNDRIFELVDYK